MKSVLVTGGMGYIGSHTVIELIKNDFEPVIVDNLSNSSVSVLDRLEKITGTRPKFYKIDLCDKKNLEKVFKKHRFSSVIHFAGFKSVGESVAEPLKYYHNNLNSTLTLLELMNKYFVNKLVFSSSATVYGDQVSPLAETTPTGQGITNPYGQTKHIIEQILRDCAIANPDLSITALRYFNPIGAHYSGLIGEDPNGIPNNLLPYVMKVAVGELPEVGVFGGDYPTPDGTGVRDYIHVVDLAQGHVAAINNIQPGFDAINLGTGQGTSVLEIIKATEQASGKTIPYAIRERRAGDLAEVFADCHKATELLHWQARKTIPQACQDSWKWQNYRHSLNKK
jgi:UDP-glucose 4-epimerase